MPSQLRIIAVHPVAGSHALTIDWSNDERHIVDLTDHIRNLPALEQLEDLAVFGQAKVGEWGFDVTWGGDLELAANTLHRMALE
jgi:hypothetical protein